MHPPMHALYHLPNLVHHLTPRPDLKPTPWLTWRLRSDANRACGCPLLGQIAAAICRCHFGQVCTPPHSSPCPNPKVPCPRYMHPPPSAPCDMPYGCGDCHEIDGGCQICMIRIACSCHFHLIHAIDMRFAACHPSILPSLTCVHCLRRLLCEDVRILSPCRFDPHPADREAVSGAQAACTVVWLLHLHSTIILPIMHARLGHCDAFCTT